MIQSIEALQLIKQEVQPLSDISVPLFNSVGSVLSENIFALENNPPFDNSAMDGFAIRAEDLKSADKTHPKTLPLQNTSKAGIQAPLYLNPGEAIKIMTGAPLPQGADAIAIKEVALPIHNCHVEIIHAPQVGDHIRRSGEDVKKGDLLIEKGVLIRPYEVALLASQGITRISVIKTPRVQVIATGDELVAPSQAIGYGQIRNSNGPAICATLKRWGIDGVNSIMVPDDSDQLESVLRSSLKKNDVVLISGGVSVGDYDFTKEILKKIGVREVFWKVAIKPGKPLYFGVLNSFCEAPISESGVGPGKSRGSQKYIFGLPGNPVSALVCLEEFVRVALEKLRGFNPHYPSYHLQGLVMNSYNKPSNRQQFIFCKVSGEAGGFKLNIIRPQGSAMMGMASRANALAMAPIGISQIKSGDRLSFRWLK